jgi:hypothetical protein
MPPADADLPDTGGNGRVTAGLVGLWKLDENAGMTLNDTSAFGTPLNLQINGPGATWIPGAIRFAQPDAAAISTEPATKIVNAVIQSNQITVEAWFRPDDLVQTGPARIVSWSESTTMRNIHLAQELAQLEGRIRTTNAGVDGSAGGVLQGGTLTVGVGHAVLTHSNGTRSLYYNGTMVDMDNPGGDLSNWASTYDLLFGNEVGLDRDWLGELHLVAIYDRALTQTEILQNFNAGTVTP